MNMKDPMAGVMMCRIKLALLAAMLVLTVSSGHFASLTFAQSTYTFLVPEPSFVSPLADMVVFIGPSSGTVSLSGGSHAPCVSMKGNYPQQAIVVVDPHGNSSTEPLRAIVLAPAPLSPGTRLDMLEDLGPCFENGVSYRKYRGTIQSAP